MSPHLISGDSWMPWDFNGIFMGLIWNMNGINMGYLNGIEWNKWI